MNAILDATAPEYEVSGNEKPGYGTALHERLSPLVNENYDLRHAYLPISDANHEMVRSAREIGASAKFTGSGGAIVGTYANDAMLKRLIAELGKRDIEVIVPSVIDDGFGG